MSSQNTISGVNRSKEEARSFYDRISAYYGWLEGVFERGTSIKGLNYLDIRSGEKVLEIGSGTGCGLQQISLQVGQEGSTCGIDISREMIRKARKRLETLSKTNNADFFQGDASRLPFESNTFDTVFTSFILELFDTLEIPLVLAEIMRVLKPGGRLGIISLYRRPSLAVKLYEWAHYKWPKYIDCRPIYVAKLVSEAGFTILKHEYVRLVILPIETVVAVKEK